MTSLKTANSDSETAHFSAPFGSAQIALHASGAWQVTLAADSQPTALNSVAVSDPQDYHPTRQKETKTGPVFSTGTLTAKVTLDPFSLSFSSPKAKAFATDLVITVTEQQIAVCKAYDSADVVYGLGEKTGWLDKRHRRYKMRNVDVWLENPGGIGIATDPLYASFPVFIVHNPQHTYGIFVDHTGFTEFDFTAETAYEFSAPGRRLTYYVLPGPTLPEVLGQYTALTGHIPLPALWTLGYHQCRWGYQSEADIRRITTELRQRHLPADSIWFDIDYMQGYRVFTWDEADFPNPAGLMADLKQQGFHAVTIIDPGVKVDEGYHVYDTGRAAQFFVTHADGQEYQGSVWPGRSAFPDFHRAEAREWWAALVKEWVQTYGLSGVWNDMNEPATTDLSGPVMEARHAAGDLLHPEARNTYGLQMARAAYQGLLAHDPDSRPFILTRAAFSGAQTVAALWGGDNNAYWEHLAGSIPLLINLGLSGMPFVGVDIGGFGNDTYGELLARWTQLGAFYPFCRNHAASNTNAHEPWNFGPEVEAICRRAIELRYQLLPYLYNLFHEAAQTGAPIWRPLTWHYSKDKNVLNLSDQVLVGPDLLLAPITAPGQTARSVYLPKGTWYRWGTDEAFEGPTYIVAQAPLDEIPLFVRGGATLPMWPLAQSTEAIDRRRTTFHIWPGNGAFDYYEDDGTTRAYERGANGSRSTRITVKTSKSGLTVKFAKPNGGYAPDRQDWTVVVHGLHKRPSSGKWNAGKHTATFKVPEDGRAYTHMLSQ